MGISHSLPLAIATGAFLTGIAFAVLAFLAPDLIQGIRDLRGPRPLLPVSRVNRDMERLLSARIFITLSILGIASLLVAVLVFTL